MTTSDKEKAILKKGLWAAQWLAASPHEWNWSQEEQEAMAHSVVILDGELRELQRLYDLVSPPYARMSCSHKPKRYGSKLCKRCYDRLAQRHRRNLPLSA